MSMANSIKLHSCLGKHGGSAVRSRRGSLTAFGAPLPGRSSSTSCRSRNDGVSSSFSSFIHFSLPRSWKADLLVSMVRSGGGRGSMRRSAVSTAIECVDPPLSHCTGSPGSHLITFHLQFMYISLLFQVFSDQLMMLRFRWRLVV